MEGKRVIWIAGFLTAFAIAIFTMMFVAMRDDKKALNAANEQLLKEKTVSTTCSATRDSLVRANADLSKYKALTMAMVSRDEATSPLKYKVGNFVYLKRDSSKVVISDIIIGGSKYEYYVKYKVLHKDNVSEEVIPELIY
jgi:hypothetical protein